MYTDFRRFWQNWHRISTIILTFQKLLDFCYHPLNCAFMAGSNTEAHNLEAHNCRCRAAPGSSSQHWRLTACACFRSSAGMSNSSTLLILISLHVSPCRGNSLYHDPRPQEIRKMSLSDPRICSLRERQQSGQIFGRNRAPARQPCPGAGAVSSWLREGCQLYWVSTRHCKRERFFIYRLHGTLLCFFVSNFY